MYLKSLITALFLTNNVKNLEMTKVSVTMPCYNKLKRKKIYETTQNYEAGYK
jgi:hypothetical protein